MALDLSTLAPERHHEDDDALIGTWHDFFFVVWKRETSLRLVRQVGLTFKELGAARRDGIGMITVVEERAATPSPEARDALSELLRSGAGRVLASAVVFEGGGFRAAAVRAVVTGLNMLARQPFPHRVFESRQQAMHWMVETGPQRWRGLESSLVRALARLRHES